MWFYLGFKENSLIAKDLRALRLNSLALSQKRALPWAYRMGSIMNSNCPAVPVLAEHMAKSWAHKASKPSIALNCSTYLVSHDLEHILVFP